MNITCYIYVTTNDFFTGKHCKELDLIFVVDASRSYYRFQLIKDFLINITTEVIHNSPRNAVGLILFKYNSAIIKFNLKAYMSLNELLSAINQLNYGSGGYGTAEALTLLQSSAQNGVLGLRSDSSKVAIVITNGQFYYNSNYDSRSTLSAAAALHASNIFDVYAVGITNTDLTVLDGIASSPEFVFFTYSFNEDSVQQLQDWVLPQLYNGKCISIYVV